MAFHLALVIHAHQPVGNFHHVLEQAYRQSYLPFLETLAEFPGLRLTLHYSGCLLEWLAAHHREFFPRLRTLVRRGQVEVLGGGFYEPILTVIPDEDRQAQLRLLANFVRRQFGQRPRGIWLAERVWEPSLPGAVAPAGVEFTLTDDRHFLAAGLGTQELFGYYVTEYLGQPLKVIPGHKYLRYAIPFRSVDETLDWLRTAAARHPEGLAAMGDDCEKFGVWPGTYEHCYQHGWLREFFQALEANRDWLRPVRASDYLDAHAPRGVVYLPTATYTEMAEWALPTPARLRFEHLRKAAEERGDETQLQFLHGGFWPNFLAKYSEANFLHKRMLTASARVRTAERPGAHRPVLRGQCNDAYWHGIFGGLYAPHLRTAVYRSLLEAERRVERRPKGAGLAWEQWDYNFDGTPEEVARGRGFVAWFEPSDGGTVREIDLLSTATPLVNSLRRRPEAYHQKLRELERRAGEAGQNRVRTIHEAVLTKDSGLTAGLIYDRYERTAFRLLVFSANRTLADFCDGQLQENVELAGGAYRVAGRTAHGLRLVKTTAEFEARKEFRLTATRAGGIELACTIGLRNCTGRQQRVRVGLETVINLLAPEAPDRYLEFNKGRQPLRWLGEVTAEGSLRLVDEYQGVEVVLVAPAAACWWCVPIETVSQSEAGFERVYQGSSLVPVWEVALAGREHWRARLVLRANPLAG